MRVASRLACVRHYHRSPPPAVAKDLESLLETHAAAKIQPITLSTLLSFGSPLTPDSVLRSVAYALPEISRRLARRVRSLESLPFIVGTNPHIHSTLNAYRESFQTLATYPPVNTPEDNVKFTETLASLVQKHANDIPTMAKGFQECTRYMSPEDISSFLNKAIRNRMSVRLIAEQHITLSQAHSNNASLDSLPGIVDMNCSPSKMVQVCGAFVAELCEATYGSAPQIVIEGFKDATFSYVPVHLEFILTEILKNSFRATVESHARTSASTPLSPVIITLSPSPNVGSSQNFFSIRVRDNGGGVSRENLDRIFSYGFTTAGRNAQDLDGDDGSGGGPYAAQQVGGSAAIGDDSSGGLFGEITTKGLQTGLGTLAGLGYGLPMSKLYATYFGGTLDLVSLDGWGTDSFFQNKSVSSNAFIS
ncbi:branched-chain alpha-ketoacid dehydrogenase [Flagelloscypha sp. PMI_526]|nr:branched-chain alpha-ketoacid dehydrogenase [Flagelloscypha sp. PMI_526]